MFFETYIALVGLLVFVPLGFLYLGNRAYQAERWQQRWEARDNQRIADEDARAAYLDELYAEVAS